MKKCPYCAEEIQDEAVVCRYCGRDLAEPKPVPRDLPEPKPVPTEERSFDLGPGTGRRGYVADNLLDKERIIWETSLHWIVFFRAIVFLAIGLAMFISSLSGTVTATSSGLLGFGGFILIIVGIIGLISAIVSRRTSEFAVTDRRVLIKTGFIKRNSLELLLAKIEGINVKQGVLGRMLGYGTIMIGGTGGTRGEFKNIKEPLEFRRQVQRQIT